MFYEDGPGAEAVLAAVNEVTKRTGATVTARATYEAGASFVGPAIDTLVKARPQAVLLLASGAPAASFIEGYRVAGGAAQLFASSGADIEQLAKRLHESALQGVAIAQVTPSPYRVTNPVAKEVADLLARNPNPETPPSYALMEGYLAGRTIIEAVRVMGAGASRAALIGALDGLDVDLGGFRVGFKNGSRVGSRFVELSIVTKDGKIRQ